MSVLLFSACTAFVVAGNEDGSKGGFLKRTAPWARIISSAGIVLPMVICPCFFIGNGRGQVLGYAIVYSSEKKEKIRKKLNFYK